jgi:3-methyladenine DNA glycosylase AlkD
MPGKLDQLREDMRKLSSPEKARVLSRFFKTGKGDYGEGDTFLGIMVPDQRSTAKKYPDLSMNDLRRLISSGMHEERLVCLFILINRYKKADNRGKKEVVDFYLTNIRYINNWDLVDLSSGPILGDHLIDGDRSMLYEMAKSDDLWERRIAVISTFAFIRENDFGDTLRIAEMLLNDRHDLIHKAVGWMLREIGKRDQAKEEEFLKQHYKKMPRTMLRYAIERFDEDKRKYYLKK